MAIFICGFLIYTSFDFLDAFTQKNGIMSRQTHTHTHTHSLTQSHTSRCHCVIVLSTEKARAGSYICIGRNSKSIAQRRGTAAVTCTASKQLNMRAHYEVQQICGEAEKRKTQIMNSGFDRREKQWATILRHMHTHYRLPPPWQCYQRNGWDGSVFV
ncbi:uncharacterized protein BCR38DRAFT_196940 [Pseudomassariella vexata]|uniref:Uncharacterized protein n=1 Tax=Pseudomassariella vexata TaxID=1141098 RepID=A0A1Y2E3F7_9PEZI|nr:uncharacterized protein BCR38DRAFT_196940 [Pseudomassariella vexata]ORY65405.1 hypothetical protein BCR38DRAFT_196940 [Pseudomassariella vexata]